MARTLTRSMIALALASAAGLGLAACSTDTPGIPDATTSAPTATPTETIPVETPSETVTPTETASATPTSSATATAVGTPVTIGCDALISAQQMYDFNPNFTLSDDYTPKAGSRSADVVNYKGLACRWVNDSSGEKIDIAVANLDAATIAGLKDKFATISKPVSTFGGTGYFTVSGSTGRADAFSGSYWIVADSTNFSEAADAKALVADAIAALG